MKFSFATQILIVVLFVLVSSAQQSPNQINQTDDNYKPVTEVNSSSNLDVRIASMEDISFGTIVEVPVTIKSGNYRLGGFDFLIRHEQSVLSFISAVPGPAFFSDSGCAWQYFIYRYGQSGNCGTSACEPGIIRVVSVANINNNILPNCWRFDEEVVLFTLKFITTSDLTYLCYSSPIDFVWYDCFDNTVPFDSLSSGVVRFGNLAGPNNVFSNELLLQPDSTFPSFGGLTETCFDSDSLYSLVNFYNGSINFPCTDIIIDDNGDINLNGIANEVADAVLFSEYFVKGLSVFTINTAGQIEATDVNRDGEFLKLEDLIYLLRIIEGNGPANPDSTIAGINVITDDKYERQVSITTDQFDVEVWLNFLGDVSPNENATATVLDWYFDGQLSRFLISGKRVNRQEDITLLEYSGKGILIDVQASTIEGYEIIVSHRTIGNDFPRRFDLHQNYPNPFNGETAIRLDLPKTGMVRFEIVNVLGQVVYDFERKYSVGSHTIYWDGSSNMGQTVGSGVYYYRITAGDFVSSKKMILLK
ncbi:MAG: T9SS type A sorting domain-containing protein [candidate division Zixibacteria bacterium]|nr:T9SS type A sorting domain-containing protein [candidate division Zixibacteria bacterium]